VNQKSKNDANLAKLPIQIKAQQDLLERDRSQNNTKAVKADQAKLDKLVKELKLAAKFHDKIDAQIKTLKSKVDKKDEQSGKKANGSNAKEIISKQQQLDKAKAKVAELEKELEKKQKKNSDTHTEALNEALN